MYFQTKLSLVSYIVSACLFFACHAGMIVLAAVIYFNKRNNTFGSKEFLDKYGTSLTEGLTGKGIFGTYWPVFVLARWSLTTTILVVLRDYFIFQIFTLLVLSVGIQAIHLTSCPFSEPLEKKSALFNEIMVSTYLTILLSLGNQTSSRDDIGVALVVTIAASFFFNFSKFSLGLFRHVQRVCRRKKIQQEAEQNKVVRLRPIPEASHIETQANLRILSQQTVRATPHIREDVPIKPVETPQVRPQSLYAQWKNRVKNQQGN